MLPAYTSPILCLVIAQVFPLNLRNITGATRAGPEIWSLRHTRVAALIESNCGVCNSRLIDCAAISFPLGIGPKSHQVSFRRITGAGRKLSSERKRRWNLECDWTCWPRCCLSVLWRPSFLGCC